MSRTRGFTDQWLEDREKKEIAMRLKAKVKQPLPAISESSMQMQCIKWFRLQYPKLSLLLFAIPNGGYRRDAEAKILSAQGVVAGVADLMLAIPGKGVHGLFVEMKTEVGKQSDYQKAFEIACVASGYGYCICRSFDEFRKLIEDYLSS